MAHASRTRAVARKRKLYATRNLKVDRLHHLLCEAFPEYLDSTSVTNSSSGSRIPRIS